MINNKKSPILDKEIKEYLKTKELNLTSTKDKLKAFKDAEYIIMATPTDYDPKKIFQHKKCRKCNNRCAGNKLRNNTIKIDNTSWTDKRNNRKIQHKKQNILTRISKRRTKIIRQAISIQNSDRRTKQKSKKNLQNYYKNKQL